MTHSTVAKAPVSGSVKTGPGQTAHRVASRVVAGLLIAGGAAMLIAAIAFYSAGGRWFIVETPSMATTAPVGSLVLTFPVNPDIITTGDVISFHPPTTPSEVYTHRVVGITASGIISTQGDLNGSPDPWELRADGVIGKAIALLPVVGWIIRGIPLLAIGAVVIWFSTSYIRSATQRSGMRIVGLSLLVSVIANMLKPFVAVTVLGSTITGDTATAAVVSTGILPIRVYADHGGDAILASGQAGDIDIPTLIDGDYYRLASELHLPLAGWVIFAVVCAAPLLYVLLIGLPQNTDDTAEATA